MKIIEMNVSDLKPYEKNPRKNDNAVKYVAKSIENFGFKVPIVIDKNNVIVCGHTRWKAVKLLKYKTVPCIMADDLTDEQIKAFRLADNRVQEMAEWDSDLLLEELGELVDWDMSDFGFELEMEPDSSEEKTGTIQKDFIYPPFSVLNSMDGTWQERKKYWIDDVGIKSFLGRENAKTRGSVSSGAQISCFYEKKEAYEKQIGRKVSNKEFNEYYAKNNNGSHCVLTSDASGILSVFDPVLAEIMYFWFNKKNGSILDPFAGGSVRGVVASLTGHNYTGIDLSKEQIEANVKQAEEICHDIFPKYINGNSLNIDSLVSDKYDMIFSCPPYFDLEKYTNNAEDLSNLEYDEFKRQYAEIIKKSCDKLKENSFAVFVVGEVRNQKNGVYRNFVSETIDAFIKAGLNYYNEFILVTAVGSGALRIRTLFKTRKVVKRHQNVLVFYKGDTKKIKENFPRLDFSNLEKE